jgi:hypothetical protein
METGKQEEMETWRDGHGILTFFETNKVENGSPGNFS